MSHIEKRVYHHWFADGVVEVVFGVWITLMGCLFATEHVASSGSVLILGRMLFILLLPLLIGPITTALRKRFVAPRAGFAQPRSTHRHEIRMLGIVGGVFALALIAVGAFIIGDQDYRWMAIVGGLIMAMLLTYAGYGTGIRRLLGEAIALVVVGVALALFLNATITVFIALQFILSGMIIFAAGGVTLVQFMTTHPEVDSETG